MYEGVGPIKPINVQSTKQKMKSYFHSPGSLILAGLVGLSALLTVLTLVFIVEYILIKGIPNLTPELFQLEYNSENVSMFPAIINTICMTALSLLIVQPLRESWQRFIWWSMPKRETSWFLWCVSQLKLLPVFLRLFMGFSVCCFL